MAYKFLVADDSQTIQKVIKITLAPEDYDLIECHSEDTLHGFATEHQPDVVLLDFNLSENKTGYDLIKELKEVKPNIKIMVLFGTFDTIDEDLLSQVGAHQYIVKPFDGNKFIQNCHRLVDDLEMEDPVHAEVETTFEDAEDVVEEEVVEEAIPEEIGVEDWVVNQPEVESKEIEEPALNEATEVNALHSELQDWGIELPPVIEGDSHEALGEFPPIIAEEDSSLDIEEEVLPSSEDLEYPDMGAMDEFPEEIKVEEGGSNSEQDIASIEDQIKTEDSLWEADSMLSEDKTGEIDISELEDIEEIKPYTLQEIKSDDIDHVVKAMPEVENIVPMQTPEDFPEAVTLDQVKEEVTEEIISSSYPSENLDSRIQEVVEQVVEEKFAKEIKKIAWEVIPDLAENLIKKELLEIREELLKRNP